MIYTNGLDKVIYYGECHCLMCDDIQSDDCLKRYFNCHDLENNRTVRIAVCSDFLRLAIHKAKNNLENEYYCGGKFYKRAAEKFIEKIIKETLNYEDEYIANDRTFTNRGLMFPICERPYVYRNIKLKTAIQLSLKGCYELNPSIKYELQVLYNQIKSFKKYKKETELFDKILKNIDWGNNQERNYKFTELLNIIFTNQIKQKQLCNQ